MHWPISGKQSEHGLSHNRVPDLGPQKHHDLPEITKQDCGSSGRHPRPPTFGPGPCPLLQFLLTSYLQEARGPACVFCPSTHPLSCLPLGQIWCRCSPLGRMTYMTRLRTLLVPGCGGFRTNFKRALEVPSLSSMAVESSNTAWVLCPTADPSPLWVSLDPGWEGRAMD